LIRNEQQSADVKARREASQERGVATQAVKSTARCRWGGTARTHFSWYEPLTDPDAISQAVRYVLATDDLFVNTTGDARLLPLIIDAATSMERSPTDAEMDLDIGAHRITPLSDGAALERI
jgi:hypothetical protein